MKDEQTNIGVGKHRVLLSRNDCTAALVRLAELAAERGQPMSMTTRYQDSNWYLIVDIGEICRPEMAFNIQTESMG